MALSGAPSQVQNDCSYKSLSPKTPRETPLHLLLLALRNILVLIPGPFSAMCSVGTCL